MNRIIKLSSGTVAAFLLANTAANACYKHTFDKCEAPVQVSDATIAQPAAAKPKAPTAQDAGWVTTVTVNR